MWTYYRKPEYFSKSNQPGVFVPDMESLLAEIAWVPPPGTYKTIDGRTEYVTEWPFPSDCLTNTVVDNNANKAKGTLTMGKVLN